MSFIHSSKCIGELLLFLCKGKVNLGIISIEMVRDVVFLYMLVYDIRKHTYSGKNVFIHSAF